ncbi:MAG: metal-dependent transcriptional regulator [Spirochaetota bacterium]
MSTPTTDDYLVAVYTLESEGQDVIGARLAELLGVKPSTVTVTIQRMIRDGLVVLLPGKRISPTEKGRRQVESLIRRHRLLERWLTDVLGIAWHQCHQDAHRLEHAINDLIANRLSVSMGNPATCPHGNPIPGNSSKSVAGTSLLLSASPLGQKMVIDRISEMSEYIPDLLEYLSAHGLQPGTSLRIKRVETPGELIIIDLCGKEMAVSKRIAEKIWVQLAAAGQVKT